MAVVVIELALLAVAQHLIGFACLFELFFAFSVPGVAVGVIF